MLIKQLDERLCILGFEEWDFENHNPVICKMLNEICVCNDCGYCWGKKVDKFWEIKGLDWD